MNISNLVLIEAALVIAALPFIYLLQAGKKQSAFLLSPNKKEFFKKTSVNIPDKNRLIELEKVAKNQGSGINFDSLIGDWKFVSIWKKDIDEEDAVFSSLLRVFSANIVFKKVGSTTPIPNFSVIATIRFGLLTIEFSGSGYLTGKQPLLKFFLNLIEFKLGSNVLLRRSLEEQKRRKKSYFTLIALGKNGEWLSARGQAGAVVIWLKE